MKTEFGRLKHEEKFLISFYFHSRWRKAIISFEGWENVSELC